MKSGNRISSPEGVNLLMRELWLHHRSGIRQRNSNIYMVDLPEPTEEDREQMYRNRAERDMENKQIDQIDLMRAVNKLGGW